MSRVASLAALVTALGCGGAHPEPTEPASAPGKAAPTPESATAGPSAETSATPAPATASASPPAPDNEAAPPAGSANAGVAAPADAPEPLPQGTTILHIGDSFAGALGIDLNRELKLLGVRGILKYQTATYIPTWAWGKDLDRYLWQFHPDLVLITLGANELQIPDPAQRANTIRHLVERLHGRPCVWVGPPLWDGARPALLDTIRESCAPCVYLDSTALVPDLPRARDGIHPSMEARKTWAKAVVGWLSQHRVKSAPQPWALRP